MLARFIKQSKQKIRFFKRIQTATVPMLIYCVIIALFLTLIFLFL
jgi:hypothetical protein